LVAEAGLTLMRLQINEVVTFVERSSLL